MAEIVTAGYNNIRTHIKSASGYTHMRLLDASNATLLTREVGVGTETTWEADEEGGQRLVAKMVVRGSHGDVSGSLPIIIAKSVLLDGLAGDEMTAKEELTYPATVSVSGDIVTIYHKTDVPGV